MQYDIIDASANTSLSDVSATERSALNTTKTSASGAKKTTTTTETVMGGIS